MSKTETPLRGCASRLKLSSSSPPKHLTFALALGALGGALLLGISTSPAQASESHTQSIDSPNSLNAVSCVPGTTDCVVSDSDGNAYYATDVSASADATWTKWTGPAGASPSEAIACPSTSLCTLADGQVERGSEGGDVYYATSLGGAWTEAFSPTWGVLAISCPSSSFCLAAQEADGDIRYATSPGSKEWTVRTIGDGAMHAVDCLSSSFCATVDNSGKVHVANTQAKVKEASGWKSTSIVPPATKLHGIACTSTTSCFAVDGEGEVLDLAINSSGEATVSKHDIDGANELTAITCTEKVTCVAVDDKGNVFVSSDGATWNEQLALGGDLTSVSCASTSLCVTADAAGDVTAFATPLFPLTVFVSGVGEVASAPAGIVCASEECAYAFEGEVTLTETPKAGSGYEFGGWVGCKKISASTCTVDVTAASEVTAVFVKAGQEGATGKEGVGIEGKAGVTGPAGEKGAAGVQGEKGPAGVQGPAGAAGKVELVTCKTGKGKRHCTTKLVSGTVTFTTAGLAAQATLSRHGVVYAAGTARIGRGGMSLRLLPVRRLRSGKYTLTLIGGVGKHERIHSESVTLGANT